MVALINNKGGSPIGQFFAEILDWPVNYEQAGSKVFDRGGASRNFEVGPAEIISNDWGPASKKRWGHGPSGPPPLTTPLIMRQISQIE